MSVFTAIVILGVLMIVGGISLMATPLISFISAGYYIIILFFVSGIFGLVRGFFEKRYDKDFFFSIFSVILGLVGLLVPGAADMSNYVLLYMAAAWFFIHGLLTIIAAIKNKNEGAGVGATVLGVVLGVLELLLGVYSVAHPATLAVGLGLLIGLYFVESGVNAISTGLAVCKGGNSLTVLFVVMGILTIIGGIAMLATPLVTFLGAGGCIILLFFTYGVFGVIRAIVEGRFDKSFLLALLGLLLGIVGLAVPGMAELNNFILLYMAAAWFIFRGVVSVIDAIEDRREGGGFLAMVIGIVLGVLEVILGVYSVIHPAALAVSLGILISFYFIESGLRMILMGSEFSRATALNRAIQSERARAAARR